MIRPETTETILDALVRFDSTSHLSNRPIIDWIADYLRGFHLNPVIVPRHNDDKKFNLFVTIAGKGDGGVCFSGHTDVVPVDNQDWTYPPFATTATEGRLYGRGTCDMKGFLACVLSRVPLIISQNPEQAVSAVFSCDEEIGCEGVISAIEGMGRLYPRPDTVIVGEPTMMSLASAHKSIYHYLTKVRGTEAHSSLPELGASALLIGCHIVSKLEDFTRELQSPTLQNTSFTPPYSTLHIGRFHSGVQQNIVPGQAEIDWEIRGLPDCNPDHYRERLDQWIAQELLSQGLFQGQAASAHTELVSITLPFAHYPGNAAERLAQRALRSNQVGTVSYGTEAGQFQRHKLDTVIIGPGSIDQAHKPDEFITIDQLRACEAFIERVVTELMV